MSSILWCGQLVVGQKPPLIHVITHNIIDKFHYGVRSCVLPGYVATLLLYCLVQLYTYQRAFMTKFSMVSSRLDVELLTTHQQLREAFSNTEVAEAKQKKSLLDNFNTVSHTVATCMHAQQLGDVSSKLLCSNKPGCHYLQTSNSIHVIHKEANHGTYCHHLHGQKVLFSVTVIKSSHSLWLKEA